MINRVLIYTALLSSLLHAGACNSGSDGSKKLKVGITGGPERAIAVAVQKEAKAKYGLEVELVLFNDYVVPNEALNNGELDLNAFQHVPYLQEQSVHRGYHLVAVGKTFLYPIAAYSKKIKQISELPNGATVTIPNDPANGGRALLLLQQAGLLSLTPKKGSLPTVRDILDNPKRIQIVELEAPQLPRTLDDPVVTLSIINSNFARQAGLRAEIDGLIVESKDSPYVNVIVARKGEEDNEDIKNFVKAYQSNAAELAAKEIFGGGAVKGW
ncbi:MetQ/NlpA family lipoprotein [Sphingobacterium bambusae]|uniref:Lipoprotein n=1 Tax=Sphingobacterium bambusae TaxID=662858 RepID=A0ABW6BD38_9SPHI|nr:MetQ/NlpA family lipoprotein [Sphingobacterium bambusae]WPL49124.1 MetQ/NlpA family lipoprotein [Sphingobacterium bambusae]